MERWSEAEVTRPFGRGEGKEGGGSVERERGGLSRTEGVTGWE